MRSLILAALAATFALVAPAAAWAETVTVTPATLPAALVAAEKAGGGLLVFEPGDYPAITIKTPGISLQLGNAHVAGIRLQNAPHVTILGGDITPSAWWGGIYAENSPYLLIQSATIHGDGKYTGVVFRNSSHGKIWLSTVSGVMTGVQLLYSDHLYVYRNDISGVLNGVTGASVQHVRVEKTTFHDFAPYDGKHHEDAMQFWSEAGKSQSDDVVLTGNTCNGAMQCADDFGGDKRGVGHFQITHNDAVISMPQAFNIQKSPGGFACWNHSHTRPGSTWRANQHYTAAGVIHGGNTADAYKAWKAWSDGPCPYASPAAVPAGATPN